MAELDPESEKTYGMSTWLTCALISWSAVLLFGLIWIITSICEIMNEWVAAAQLLTIVSSAAGVLFITIYKDENKKNGKRPRVLFAVFLFLAFVAWPIWALILPDDIHVVYNNLRFIGMFFLAWSAALFTIFFIDKYARGKRGFGKLFTLGDNFNAHPFRIKVEISITSAFLITVILMVFDDLKEGGEFIYWVLGGVFGHLIITYVPKTIKHLRDGLYSEPNGSSDEQSTCAQLSERVNSLTKEVNELKLKCKG